MRQGLRKAYEITEARIQFVSLVDKAANLRTFLLKKAENGTATFATCGRILKADPDSHHITGVVYEPMTEDSQGNYMTEEEITKAAYYFAKNSGQVDIQHSFKPFDGATIVENWVAKADFTINGEAVKKGTWLMTMEVSDPRVWSDIEKGNITGFSMGGVGKYSEEDTDLETVNKQDSEKKGLMKRLAEMLGIDTVEKEATEEPPGTGQDSPPVEKAGRKMSCKNRETLSGIYESLGAFLKEFDDPEDDPSKKKEGEPAEEPEEQKNEKIKEEDTVSKQEIQALTDSLSKAFGEAIEKALGTAQGQTAPAPAPAAPATTTGALEKGAAPGSITAETIQQMVNVAVEKATNPKQEPATLEQIQGMIDEAVAKAVEPIFKSKGLPTNLGASTVEKQQEEHYLHGLL